MNGSAAYADIDSSVAVAVMRNRLGAPDPAAAAEVDRTVAEVFRTRTYDGMVNR